MRQMPVIRYDSTAAHHHQMSAGDWGALQVWAVSAHAADRPLHCICPRIPGTTYFAEHHDPRWLLLRHQAGESDYSLLCRSSDALDVSNKSA